MPADRPLVSVLLSTYNHENYIAESVRSVLNQTLTDLELVVVDDESTDDTPRILAGIEDPRLVKIRKRNGGPSSAWNTAIEASRGKFVAFLNGDDVCRPRRLEAQVAAYGDGPAQLLFSESDFIDDDGRDLGRDHFLASSFDFVPESSADYVRRVFYHGNCVNAVTAFTERSVVADDRFDPLLYQMQDLDMWVRLVHRAELRVLPERLVAYRIRGSAGNLSAPSAASQLRTANEFSLILPKLFDGMPAALFRAAFGDRLLRPDCDHPAAQACETAFLLTEGILPASSALGIARLAALLADPDAADCLARHYDFGPPAFARLIACHDAYGRHPELSVASYLDPDTGSGFDSDDRVHRVVPQTGAFRIAFPLAGRRLDAVRWFPTIGRLTRMRLDGAAWRDAAGVMHPVRMEDIEFGPGKVGEDGMWEFDSADPRVIFPVGGEATAVEVRGEWEIASVVVTASRLNYRLAVAESRLGHAHDCLAEARANFAALEAALADRDARLADIDSCLAFRYLRKAASAWRKLAGMLRRRAA